MANKIQIPPEPPAQLKAVQAFMKVASDIERVEPVVSYWVRLYATEMALKIDRESIESKKYLGTLLAWLEQFKQSNKENEAVSNQTVGQAHYENFVFNLFNKADTIDRNGEATKSTVVMFYMATVLFEAMAVFGPISDEMAQRAKYAKFKAAYLQKCFRTGQTPKPGPIEGTDLEDPSGSQNNEDGSPVVPVSGSGEHSKPTSSNDEKSKNSDPYILTPTVPPKAASSYKPPPELPSSTPNSKQSSDTPKSSNQNQPADSSFNTSNSTGQSTIATTSFHAMNGAPLNPEDLIKSQRFCKFANSALLYDDIPTAVVNLEKALKLLTTGQNSD